MGNTHAAKGGGLATVAVAKYLHLSKHQVLLIRDTLQQYASRNHTVRAKHLRYALAEARVNRDPDQQVLKLMFKMWDLEENDRVNYLDYVVGISPLACPFESLTNVLKYSMQVMDRRNKRKITANQLVFLLKSINVMASYLGDAVLTLRQIHKIVDNVFDTMTLVSFDSGDLLSHDECVKLLLQEPLIQQAAFNDLSPTVRFAEEEAPFGPSRRLYEEEEEQSFASEFSAFSSDISSVFLTPLTRVPVLLAPRRPEAAFVRL